MTVERSDISGLFEGLTCLFFVLAGLGSRLPRLDKTGLKMSDWIFPHPCNIWTFYSHALERGCLRLPLRVLKAHERAMPHFKREMKQEREALKERERARSSPFEVKRIPTICFMAFHDGWLGIIYHFKLEYGKFSSILQHANDIIYIPRYLVSSAEGTRARYKWGLIFITRAPFTWAHSRNRFFFYWCFGQNERDKS